MEGLDILRQKQFVVCGNVLVPVLVSVLEVSSLQAGTISSPCCSENWADKIPVLSGFKWILMPELRPD